MKESSHKSRKHSKPYNDDKYIKRHERNDKADKYHNVLKERHYKDSEHEKNEKNHHKNSKSHCNSHKEKSKSSSDHKDHRNHPKSIISLGKRSEEKKVKTRDQIMEESYEELSRKKKKIESELHALDLEEAAEREAERKRSQKQSTDTNKKKEEPVRIKEELLSDDEREKRTKEKTKNRSVPSDSKNQRSRPQSSRPTGGNDNNEWGNPSTETKKVEKVKEKPNFAISGKLAEDTNMYNGVVIKYNEPVEARKPRRRWRLYPFKGDSDLPFIPIHRQSAYLFGRTRSIADIPIDHPSCSKQHAVLQFRLVTYKKEDGSSGRRVRPYIIDLESSNGTFVNNKKIEPRCYVELMEKDVVKFGYSSREYVLLHEDSRNEEEDDDYTHEEN